MNEKAYSTELECLLKQTEMETKMNSTRREEIKENTESFYEEVIRRNSETVYRLAYSLVRSRSDANDIYQEVFLRYVRKKPVFDGQEHEKAWFLRVTVNCCKNYWKSPWMQRRSGLEEGVLEKKHWKKEHPAKTGTRTGL